MALTTSITHLPNPFSHTFSTTKKNNPFHYFPILNIFPNLITQNIPKKNPIFINKAYNLNSNNGFWEEPDNGSESEYEDENGNNEENDLDFESDWEEEQRVGLDLVKNDNNDFKGLNANELVDDDLIKEVEQLLEPEEREILLQNAAPNMAKISTEKWGALHSLALSGQIPHMDILLANGVNINLVDKNGRTALHTAVMGKKEAVISHLLRKGASPHVRDHDGASPLHYAVQVGALQTVKLLIKYNVDLSTEDNEGWTPLHIAVQTRNRDITKVLLVNGADKNRRNKKGKTPLDLALCYGKDFKSYDLAKLLKVLPNNRDF